MPEAGGMNQRPGPHAPRPAPALSLPPLLRPHLQQKNPHYIRNETQDLDLLGRPETLAVAPVKAHRAPDRLSLRDRALQHGAGPALREEGTEPGVRLSGNVAAAVHALCLQRRKRVRHILRADAGYPSPLRLPARPATRTSRACRFPSPPFPGYTRGWRGIAGPRSPSSAAGYAPACPTGTACGTRAPRACCPTGLCCARNLRCSPSEDRRKALPAWYRTLPSPGHRTRICFLPCVLA